MNYDFRVHYSDHDWSELPFVAHDAETEENEALEYHQRGPYKSSASVIGDLDDGGTTTFTRIGWTMKRTGFYVSAQGSDDDLSLKDQKRVIVNLDQSSGTSSQHWGFMQEGGDGIFQLFNIGAEPVHYIDADDISLDNQDPEGTILIFWGEGTEP